MAASLLVQQANSPTVRPLAHFSPSVWTDHFAATTFDPLAFESYVEEIEGLKEHVRGMLMDTTANSTEKMNLIDSLHRLGLSYHFHNEIGSQLESIFGGLKFEDDKAYDLYTISVQFRVFRQHGFNMSCDIFNNFRDSNGNFYETLASDTKGLLSLYEASQLRFHEEDVLEEALAFTTTHLTTVAASNGDHLAKQVTKALGQSFHKGIPRVEAKYYISITEQDKLNNEQVLRLAKLDFNFVQLIHQQELSLMSKWWKDLELPSRFPYARQRLVECYLLTIVLYFEPCYSMARIMLTKILAVITVIDDTFDSYGTIEELQAFTEAVDRWDVSCVDLLPDYMKPLCSILLNLYDEFEEQVTKEGGFCSVYHSKETMKELCRSYYQEAKWLNSKIVPSFQEYIDVSFISCTFHMLTISSYMGMGGIATEEAFEWIQGRPKILRAVEVMGRLQNDIVGSEVEQKRGHVASGVECYMKEYGVSRKEAIFVLKEMVSNAWKDVNEECVNRTGIVIPQQLLMPMVNLARIMDVIYKYEDGFTNPDKVEECITSLFVDPVPVPVSTIN